MHIIISVLTLPQRAASRAKRRWEWRGRGGTTDWQWTSYCSAGRPPGYAARTSICNINSISRFSSGLDDVIYFKGFELIGFNETKMIAYSILLFYPYSKNRKMRLYFSTVCNSLTINPVCFSYHFTANLSCIFPFPKTHSSWFLPGHFEHSQ